MSLVVVAVCGSAREWEGLLSVNKGPVCVWNPPSPSAPNPAPLPVRRVVPAAYKVLGGKHESSVWISLTVREAAFVGPGVCVCFCVPIQIQSPLLSPYKKAQ